jgi:hypothetical protein
MIETPPQVLQVLQVLLALRWPEVNNVDSTEKDRELRDLFLMGYL